jgi:hypothetical protein
VGADLGGFEAEEPVAGRVRGGRCGELVVAGRREDGRNLRTNRLRIVAEADAKTRSTLFQHLRPAGQTELAERRPEHLACGWLGNSRLIAREHYLQIHDCDTD